MRRVSAATVWVAVSLVGLGGLGGCADEVILVPRKGADEATDQGSTTASGAGSSGGVAGGTTGATDDSASGAAGSTPEGQGASSGGGEGDDTNTAAGSTGGAEATTAGVDASNAGNDAATTGGATAQVPVVEPAVTTPPEGSGTDSYVTTAEGYSSLAVEPGLPLTEDTADKDVFPPAPPGFLFYPVDGAHCRDGTDTGIYVHHAPDSDRLLIYFEGGGACTTQGFCHFNPANIDMRLSGRGEDVLSTAGASMPGRQQPGVYQDGQVTGVFDERPENPFRDWNWVYIPYCTGDVHFGTNEAAEITDLPAQWMVGYENTKLFVSRMAGTFQGKLSHVVVSGSSAGSFGAALNYSMIQDTFDHVQVDALLDSGAPFKDEIWPPCQQKRWRELFGFDRALPADCEECFAENGGGLLAMADYLLAKHPKARLSLISTMNDEVIRLFFTPGKNDCELVQSADPFELTVAQLLGEELYSAELYAEGLSSLRERYESTGRFATYYMPGALHQHITRPRFFEPVVEGVTMATFVTDFLNGQLKQYGP